MKKNSIAHWKIATMVLVPVVVLYFIGMAAINSLGPNKNLTAVSDNKSLPQPAQRATESLSKRTESTLLANMGYDSMQELRAASGSSNLAYLNGFEDVSAGTVRAFVQKDITKEDAQNVGKLVMATVGSDLKDLDWVVVRGTDGIDVNVSRSDIPALR